MTQEEIALLQAQATIYAGHIIAKAIYMAQELPTDTESELLRQSQATAHLLAQNLDLNTGKP